MVLYTLIAVAGAATHRFKSYFIPLSHNTIQPRYVLQVWVGHQGIGVNWCNCWTCTYRCIVHYEFAASNELPGDSHSRCYCGIGNLYGELASVCRGIYSSSNTNTQYSSYQKCSELSRYLNEFDEITQNFNFLRP